MLDVRVCNVGSKAHFTLTEINESYEGKAKSITSTQATIYEGSHSHKNGDNFALTRVCAY